MELAVVAKDTTMLDMLLQNGFSPDSGFGRALFLSLKADKYDHFRLLMDAGVKLDIREKGMLPLHLVIDRNLPRQFSDDLIQAGADINALTAGYADDGCGPEDPQSSEETPLHIAARRLCPEIVPLLLSRNAMSSQLDQSKLTPLAAAVFSAPTATEKDVAQGLATIKALIEGGCPKDIVDSNGQPIIKAIGKVQRERVTEDPEIAKARPAYANPPFVLEPRSYLGPHGFDATRLTIRPLLQEIMRIWDTCP